MRVFTILLLFVVKTLQLHALTTGKAHSTVQNLVQTDFDEALSDPANGLWLIKFYAPWCGHCKKLAPTLEQIAEYMAGKMAIGKVDCTVEKALCKQYDVKGYPSLRVFRDGTYYGDYPGSRNADSIIEFGERMAMPAVQMASTYTEVMTLFSDSNAKQTTKKTIVNNSVQFIAFDGNVDTTLSSVDDILGSTPVLQVYRQVARKQQAYSNFALLHPSTPKSELEKFGIEVKDENEDELTFLMRVERGVDTIVYNGEVTTPDFMNFVSETSLPLLTELEAHNFRSMGNKGKILAIAVINPEDAESNKVILQSLSEYSKEKMLQIQVEKSPYIFTYMNGMKWAKFLEQFSVSTDDLPQLFLLDVPNRKYWQNVTVGRSSTSDGILLPIAPSYVKEFMAAKDSGVIESRDQFKEKGGFMNDIAVGFMKSMPYSAIALVLFFVFVILFVVSDSDEDVQQIEQNMKSRDSLQKKTKGD